MCADISNVDGALIRSTSRCESEDLHKASKSSRAERLRSEHSPVHADKPEFKLCDSACDFFLLYMIKSQISNNKEHAARSLIFHMFNVTRIFITFAEKLKIICQILRQINPTFGVTRFSVFSLHFVKMTCRIPETWYSVLCVYQWNISMLWF